MKRLLTKFGSTRLMTYLLFSLGFILFTGAVLFYFQKKELQSLNRLSLSAWYCGPGSSRPLALIWISLLILILVVLAVNTLCCILLRLSLVWPLRRELPVLVFLRRLAPTLVHILFAVILLGHLLSSQFSYFEERMIQVGDQFMLANGFQVSVSAIEKNCFSGPPALAGKMRQAHVRIGVAWRHEKAEGELAFLEPFHWRGYLFFLDGRDKYATSPGELKIVCRRDLGMPLIAAGYLLMVGLLLFFYFYRKGES